MQEYLDITVGVNEIAESFVIGHAEFFDVPWTAHGAVLSSHVVGNCYQLYILTKGVNDLSHPRYAARQPLFIAFVQCVRIVNGENRLVYAAASIGIEAETVAITRKICCIVCLLEYALGFSGVERNAIVYGSLSPVGEPCAVEKVATGRHAHGSIALIHDPPGGPLT